MGTPSLSLAISMSYTLNMEANEIHRREIAICFPGHTLRGGQIYNTCDPAGTCLRPNPKAAAGSRTSGFS